MLSIVIPTLNEASNLPNLLASLTKELRSRYNLEIIVSDNGSTDDTVAFARKAGVRVVGRRSEEKKNISECRNRGARAAQGEVLMFLDADCLPRNWEYFFDRSFEALHDQRIIALTFRFAINPKEQRWIDVVWMFYFNLLFLFLNVLGLGMGRGNCQVVRRAAFQKINGYNTELVAGEDFDFYRRLRRIGRIRFLWSVVVYELPRRFRKLGYVRVALQWFVNSMSIMILGRSWSREWRDVR